MVQRDMPSQAAGPSAQCLNQQQPSILSSTTETALLVKAPCLCTYNRLSVFMTTLTTRGAYTHAREASYASHANARVHTSRHQHQHPCHQAHHFHTHTQTVLQQAGIEGLEASRLPLPQHTYQAGAHMSRHACRTVTGVQRHQSTSLLHKPPELHAQQAASMQPTDTGADASLGANTHTIVVE